MLYARITPSGSTAVFAQRLSRDRTRLEEEPITLTESLRNTDLQFSYAVWAGGALMYRPSPGDREKLVVDRRGTVLDTVRQRGTYPHAVAHTRRGFALAAGFDLWLYNLDRDTSTPRFTSDMGRFAFDPIWSPHDESLAFRPCSYGRVDELPKGSIACRSRNADGRPTGLKMDGI